MSVPIRALTYAYDTEFIEDGKTIDLISIGIACEDGREYYAVNKNMPLSRIRKHEWLMSNVVPQLPQPQGDRKFYTPKRWLYDYSSSLAKPRNQIAAEVRDFLLPGNSSPRIWADFCSYDHVVLAQLFGRMTDLPDIIPRWTRELRQALEAAGWPDVPVQRSGSHNALEDARHVLRTLRHIGVVDR